MSQVILLPTVDTQPLQGSALKHKEALQKEPTVRKVRACAKKELEFWKSRMGQRGRSGFCTWLS